MLAISNAQVTPSEAAPGEKVIVSADILSEGVADAVHVYFIPDATAWQAHQNDPSRPDPGTFDLEVLPHIAAGETDHTEVPYRANSCGTQEILIVASAGTQWEPATATASLSTGPCLTYFPLAFR